MIKLHLTSDHLREIHKKGYNSDILVLLIAIKNGEDVMDIAKDMPKLASIVDSLFRKGLMTDSRKLTLEGEELISFLSSKGDKSLVKKKKDVDHDFLLWWSHYRSTDDIFLGDKTGNSEDKTILFSGSRGLKAKKEDCKIKYNKIIAEGEYTPEDLLRALEYEIKLKIKKSIETKENKLSYMQNSLTYLNQRTFENFIEVSKTPIYINKSINKNETFI